MSHSNEFLNIMKQKMNVFIRKTNESATAQVEKSEREFLKDVVSDNELPGNIQTNSKSERIIKIVLLIIILSIPIIAMIWAAS